MGVSVPQDMEEPDDDVVNAILMENGFGSQGGPKGRKGGVSIGMKAAAPTNEDAILASIIG